MINKLENELAYGTVFSPERNEFFKQGGFRSSNYKRAKAHFNKILKSLEQDMKEGNKSGMETCLKILNNISEEVFKMYQEAKVFKETGRKREDLLFDLVEEVAHCEYEAKEANKKGQSLSFLGETLHDPEFLLKASLSRNPSLLRTIQSLETMYQNSLYSDRPRIQNDIRCFVNSVIKA